MKRIILFIILLFTLSVTIHANTNVVSMEVEQVVVHAPEAYAIVRYKDINGEIVDVVDEDMETSVKVDGLTTDTLDVSNVDLNEHYYFLIDNSASMNHSFVKNMKDTLIQWNEDSNNQVDMTILTFDEDIEVIYSSNDDDLSESLNKVDGEGSETKLYEAINTFVSLASSNVTAGFERQVAIVISDGYDYDTAGITKDEIIQVFEQHNYPVNAIIHNTNSQSTENLAEITRKTNGVSVIVNDENFESSFDELVFKINQYELVPFNLVDTQLHESTQTLLVSTEVSDLKLSSSANFKVNSYQEDKIIPKVIDVIEENNTLTIHLENEIASVTSANQFRISNGEDVILAEFIEMSSPNVIKLKISDYPSSGTYHIQYMNLIDGGNSFEKLENSTFSITLETNNDPILIIGVVGAVVVLVAIIIILKRKKNSKYKLILGVINPFGNKTLKEIELIEELVIGRASDCGLSLMDKNITKKHCKIIVIEKEIYIEDLHSTNGTRVNGEPLPKEKMLLKNGDVIQVGDHYIEFMVEKL